MCKDHKMVLSKLKLTFENVSEDKESFHEKKKYLYEIIVLKEKDK